MGTSVAWVVKINQCTFYSSASFSFLTGGKPTSVSSVSDASGRALGVDIGLDLARFFGGFTALWSLDGLSEEPDARFRLETAVAFVLGLEEAVF